MTELTVVGQVIRRNGAYLCMLSSEVAGDLATVEAVDAASSKKRAKAVLREMATGEGYGRPWRWEHPLQRVWTLEGKKDEER